MSDKPKFPLAIAQRLGERIRAMLAPLCEKIEVAGSIRRRKELIGDVEILYVPQFGQIEDQSDLFGQKVSTNLVDKELERWLALGWIEKRPRVDGAFTWGDEIKLARSTATTIPIDFFATSQKHWWNYLVCRTGSAEHNIKIASRAREMGYEWHPMKSGFTKTWSDGRVDVFPMESEQALFAFLQWNYKEPHARI